MIVVLGFRHWTLLAVLFLKCLPCIYALMDITHMTDLLTTVFVKILYTMSYILYTMKVNQALRNSIALYNAQVIIRENTHN